ncbi:MAG: hypothetical protein QOF01_1634 [Thermomicrobiales bacterium]|nr:hypothetical protein [Thermomicrobiales bacterium]
MSSLAIAASIMNALTSMRANLLTSATLMLVLILGLGLLTVSYVDVAFYLVGVAVVLPVLALGALLRERSGALGWRQWILPITVVALVAVAVTAVSLRQQPTDGDGELPLGGPQPVPALGYVLQIEPVDRNARSFKITREEISLADDPRGYVALIVSHPEEITSRAAGVLRRQVRLDALVSRESNATLVLADGSSQEVHTEPLHGSLRIRAISGEPLAEGDPFLIVTVCRPTCPATDVELSGFPSGAFQKAVARDYKTIDTFDDTEKITWQLARPSDEIAFSYVIPRYRWLYPVVKPFLSLSSLGHLAMVLFGTVVAIVANILKPALVAVATKTLKHWLHALGGTTWIRRLSLATGTRDHKPPRPRKRRGRR